MPADEAAALVSSDGPANARRNDGNDDDDTMSLQEYRPRLQHRQQNPNATTAGAGFAYSASGAATPQVTSAPVTGAATRVPISRPRKLTHLQKQVYAERAAGGKPFSYTAVGEVIPGARAE